MKKNEKKGICPGGKSRKAASFFLAVGLLAPSVMAMDGGKNQPEEAKGTVKNRLVSRLPLLKPRNVEAGRKLLASLAGSLGGARSQTSSSISSSTPISGGGPIVLGGVPKPIGGKSINSALDNVMGGQTPSAQVVPEGEKLASTVALGATEGSRSPVQRIEGARSQGVFVDAPQVVADLDQEPANFLDQEAQVSAAQEFIKGQKRLHEDLLERARNGTLTPESFEQVLRTAPKMPYSPKADKSVKLYDLPEFGGFQIRQSRNNDQIDSDLALDDAGVPMHPIQFLRAVSQLSWRSDIQRSINECAKTFVQGKGWDKFFNNLISLSADESELYAFWSYVSPWADTPGFFAAWEQAKGQLAEKDPEEVIRITKKLEIQQAGRDLNWMDGSLQEAEQKGQKALDDAKQNVYAHIRQKWGTLEHFLRVFLKSGLVPKEASSVFPHLASVLHRLQSGDLALQMFDRLIDELQDPEEQKRVRGQKAKVITGIKNLEQQEKKEKKQVSFWNSMKKELKPDEISWNAMPEAEAKTKKKEIYSQIASTLNEKAQSASQAVAEKLMASELTVKEIEGVFKENRLMKPHYTGDLGGVALPSWLIEALQATELFSWFGQMVPEGVDGDSSDDNIETWEYIFAAPNRSLFNQGNFLMWASDLVGKAPSGQGKDTLKNNLSRYCQTKLRIETLMEIVMHFSHIFQGDGDVAHQKKRAFLEAVIEFDFAETVLSNIDKLKKNRPQDSFNTSSGMWDQLEIVRERLLNLKEARR